MMNPMSKALLSAWLAVFCIAAHAQEYPSKPIRIIAVCARWPGRHLRALYCQRLQDSLGQSVVVDNRPGAGAIIGTDAVAKSPADGYTLLMMSNTHTVNESLIPNKPTS